MGVAGTMAVDERARRQLYERLEEMLGPDAADTLMEQLAFLGREQLATRQDLELVRRDMVAGFEQVRADFSDFRGETRAAIEALRGDFADVRGDTRASIEESRGDFSALRGETRTSSERMRADMHEQFNKQGERIEALAHLMVQQTRQLMIGMVGIMLTIAAIAFGAVQLT